MIRTFMTTTALAALLASGAIAQDAPATTEAPAIEAPAAGTEAQTETEMEVVEEVEVVTTDANTQMGAASLATGYNTVDTDNLASNIMGAPVYSSTADDADQIGDISDLVVNENGEVAAVIIGVGGFLGLGQKEVAVDYSELEWTIAADNTQRFVLGVTREHLEAAPEFERVERDAMATGVNTTAPGAATDPALGTDAMAPADNAMAPTGTGMAFDRSAMTDLDEATLTAEDLEGTDVYGPNDEHIGTIGDLVLGEGGSIDAVIIDFGGFLGIGVKQVAVAYENLQFLGDEAGNRLLLLNMTREQMEQAPEYNPDTYALERDAQRVVVQ
ncbi:MAG TPA: PRC-barrel domain-containing protein [Devosiaceae bacterium]|jgi:sporulation protein YlmC with PRC-barrel domain|nr:PRC-barrel domain-containing protein [Devosiaceae bacterium]